MKDTRSKQILGSILVCLSILLTTALWPNVIFADCLACWRLVGIELLLKDKTRLTGYVRWNPLWFGLTENELKSGYGKNGDFHPNIFISPARYQYGEYKGFRIYTDVVSTTIQEETIEEYGSHVVDIDVVVGIEEHYRDVVLETISDIKIKPGRYDGYNAAGDLQLVSQDISTIIRDGSLVSATRIHERNTMNDLFILNYNPFIGLKKFEEIVAELQQMYTASGSGGEIAFNAYLERIESLSKEQLIFIRVAYD